jgi:hypothetical protein
MSGLCVQVIPLSLIKLIMWENRLSLMLNRLNIDIAGLDTPPWGWVTEGKKLYFLWKGRGINETRQHGVGFAVKNNRLSSIESAVGGSERLLAIRMLTSCGYVPLITAYAPTLITAYASAKDTKDEFYQELDNVVNATPKSDCIYILGNLNARVQTHGQFASGNSILDVWMKMDKGCWNFVPKKISVTQTPSLK